MNTLRRIEESARQLVGELGEDAPRFAATRAHQLLKAGDSNGYALWNSLRLETYRQLWSPEAKRREDEAETRAEA